MEYNSFRRTNNNNNNKNKSGRKSEQRSTFNYKESTTANRRPIHKPPKDKK